jgi:GNAT superfamily N-acetyltransferase
MKIVKFNRLTPQLKQEIEILVSIVNKHDGTRASMKLDNSIQYYPEMDNLYLGYEGDTLVSAIKCFSILPATIELSGYTHPEYRGKGFFKQLLIQVYHEARAYGYEDVWHIIDTGSEIGIEWTLRKGLAYQKTEVVMSLVNYSSNKGPQGLFLKQFEDIELPVLIQLHEELFKLKRIFAEKYLNKVMNFKDKFFYALMDREHILGIGGIYYENEKAILYGIGIRERFRGNGYSKVLIDALIEEARNKGYCKIELEVDQDNQVAYRLYKNIGFVDLYAAASYREVL